jgi:phospholipid transport system substrate-binding protein
MRRLVRFLAAGLAALTVTAPAWAGAPTEQVRQYTDQVRKILEDPALRSADKRAAVRKVAIEIFDVNETARRALGPHWQGRSPSEKNEFTQLFADLLERTYISKIDLYRGERLQYTTEAVDGEFAIVRAKVITNKGVEVPVEARMLKRAGAEHWLIYDIAIENVSLISNYRTQFDRIIRTASYGELVRRLKENREQFLNEKPAQAGRTS